MYHRKEKSFFSHSRPNRPTASQTQRMVQNAARQSAIQTARAFVSVPRPIMGGNTRMLPAQLSARNPEVKAVDLPAALYTLNTTQVITPLNLVAVGSSFFNRIGRRIEMKNIRITGSIETTNNASTDADYCRIVIIYDRQTNGALPAFADIFQDTAQDGTNTNNSLSNVNLNNRDRFVILRDLRLFLPLVSVTGSPTFFGAPDPVEPTYNIDLFVRLKGLVTQYKADSSPAVIGDIATGGLFLVTFGSKAVGSDSYRAHFSTRLRFNDS